MSTIFVVPRGVIEVKIDNEYASINYEICDENFYKKINALEKHFVPRVDSNNVYVITNGLSGPELTSIGKAALELERDNYTSEVLDSFDNIITDLRSDRPAGRIIILEGKPGTGKTFLVRAVLHEAPKSTCVIVPASMLSQLAGPQLISILLSAKQCGGNNYPVILLIEDGDIAILKRDVGNINILTSLLNFGDGLLGGLIDLRVIITTNAKKIEIDDAIKRPGRLSGTISVDALSPEKANSILLRLLNEANIKEGLVYEGNKLKVSEPFEYRTTLAEIYNKAKSLGWKPSESSSYKYLSTKNTITVAEMPQPYY